MSSKTKPAPKPEKGKGKEKGGEKKPPFGKKKK
jgi:hypothetical protein